MVNLKESIIKEIKMNKEILEKNVYYYKNVIPDPKKFIEIIESTETKDLGNSITKWQDWTTCSGEMYTYGSQKVVSLDEAKVNEPKDKEAFDYIYKTVTDIFYNVCKDYATSLGDFDEPIILPVFDIKKYSAGTFMGAHFDQQEGDKRLRYSLVFYLNDDYEGGEISFTITSPDAPIIHGKPEEDYEIAKDTGKITIGIKPEAGSVLIFPSSPPYHHTAHIVKSGFKYMIPMHWYNDLSDGTQPTDNR
jgi:hypothetical protein